MRRAFVAILILAVIGSLMSCVTLVRSDEWAVVRRFGKILPEKVGPGLLFGLPWGIDVVNRVSVKDRTITVGWVSDEADENSEAMTPGLLLTGDHNLVNVQAVIEYRVMVDQVDRYVLTQERVEPLIVRAAEAAMAQWQAAHQVDDAILTGKKTLQLFLKDRIEAWIAPYELGVQIDRASIQLIDPPGQVVEYFNEVSQAHAGMETQINKARQERATRSREADEEVFRIARATAAYVREQKLAAQGDADNFLIRLAEYRRLRQSNPQFLNYLWLDEVTRIYDQLRRSGRLDVLDHYLGADGLNITQFPLQKKRP